MTKKATKAPAGLKPEAQAAWQDIMGRIDPTLNTPENAFTIEMAAILMAKLRSGKRMIAAEMKELRRQLDVLGLAQGNGEGTNGSAGKKPRKNAKYFGKGAASSAE